MSPVFRQSTLKGCGITLVAFVSAAAAQTAPVPRAAPIPRLEPIPENGNLPLNSAKYAMSLDYGDLSRYGYVEQEYYFSGTASTREQESAAVLKADLPYVSRLVVRMPANPAAFSGNVILEPFHAAFEKTDIWQQVHRHITERGDIWVGYTVKGYGLDMEPPAYFLGGVPMLKAYDAQRYGRLQLESDLRPLTMPPPTPMPPQAIDLTAQVGAMLKGNVTGSPLAGYRVRRLFLVGAGINGDIAANWLTTGQHDAWTTPAGGQIFDGYLYGIQFRFPPKPPKNAVHIMYRGTAETSRAAESGWLGKEPDGPNYRVYNFIGMSHIGAYNSAWQESTIPQINSVLPQPGASMPKLPWVIDNAGGCADVNDDPVNLALGALLVRMEENRTSGTPLPPSPQPATQPADAGAVMWDKTGRGDEATDKKVAALKLDPVTGNALGGVRLPWVAAPVAHYPQPVPIPPPPPADATNAHAAVMPNPPAGLPRVRPSDGWPRASIAESKLPHRPGGNFCPIFHPRVPLGGATLRQLYSGYADYTNQFAAAKAMAVRQGWLLKADADQLRPRGTPADFDQASDGGKRAR